MSPNCSTPISKKSDPNLQTPVQHDEGHRGLPLHVQPQIKVSLGTTGIKIVVLNTYWAAEALLAVGGCIPLSLW